MNKNIASPKKRSYTRLKLGKLYFRIKRNLKLITQKNVAKIKPFDDTEYEYFAHQTPLLRQLKDVDMQLQYNKITNLRIAAAKVNGVVLQPGETFSYWRTVGKPTHKKGYVDGMILEQGKVTVGIGGGLCQLSNLIYWLTIHTPLTIIERHRHSFDVFPDSNRTQPFASGATCFYNYIDLQIKNDTKLPFKLEIAVTDEYLVGKWITNGAPNLSYKVYEKEHLIQSQPWGGYTRHNVIHRKVFNENLEQVGDQFVAENHAIMMYNPLLPG